MKALLAIAEREIRDRWLLLAGAVLVGLIPWMLIPLDPSRTVLAFVGPFGAVLFGAIAALLAGWTVIGSDLSEGRLGFFFSRPVPWWAIWGGKWLAGAVLTLGSTLVLWLMVVPLDREAAAKMPQWFFEGSVAFAGAWCLLLMAMGHVASVAFRSRSSLLALDLVLLPVSAFLFLWLGAPLIATGAIFGGSGWSVLGRVAVVAGVFTLAGAVQVAVGRIDKRRGHRAMSTVLWSGVTILIAIVGLSSYRLTHLGLEDLYFVHSVNAAPQGTWVAVQGMAKNPLRDASFLVDTSSGRVFSRPAFPPPSRTAFTRDGRSAVWLEASGPVLFFTLIRGTYFWDRLVVARLDGPSLSTSRLPIASPVRRTWRDALALSSDGTRLAVGSGDSFDVFDVASGRHLTGISAPGNEWVSPVRFASGSKVHAYRQPKNRALGAAPTLELVEVDSDTRSSAIILGRLSLDEGEAVVQARDDGRILVRTKPSGPSAAVDRGPHHVLVHEMPSGRILTSITIPASMLRDAFLLEDGRVAVLHEDRAGALELDLHSPEGAPLWSLPFESKARGGSIGGLLAPDRLVATTGVAFPGSLGAASTVVVSLSTGTVLHSFADTSVIARSWWHSPTAPEPLAARILKTRGGGLVLLDPEGESTRTVVALAKDL